MKSFLAEKFSIFSHKQSLFGVAYLVLTSVFHFVLYFAIANSIDNVWLMGLLLLLFLVWLVSSALAIVFLEKNLYLLLAGFTVLLWIVLFGFYSWNIVGIVLAGLFLWIAKKRADAVKGFLSEFKMIFVGRRSLTFFFTALALVSVFAYNSIFLQAYYDDGLQVPKNVYKTVFTPADLLLDAIFLGYEKGGSVEELEKAVVEGFLGIFIPQEYKEEQEVSAPSFLDQDTAEASLEEFTLGWINTTIENNLEPYSEFMPIFFLVGLLLAFKFIYWPFAWITILLSALAIKILSLYNILTIEEITITKKTPIL